MIKYLKEQIYISENYNISETNSSKSSPSGLQDSSRRRFMKGALAAGMATAISSPSNKNSQKTSKEKVDPVSFSSKITHGKKALDAVRSGKTGEWVSKNMPTFKKMGSKVADSYSGITKPIGKISKFLSKPEELADKAGKSLDTKMNRRDFLKVSAASALAAGKYSPIVGEFNRGKKRLKRGMDVFKEFI